MTSLRLLLRFLTVGGLVLLLLIPLLMIRGLVHDRSQFRDQAVGRVERSMAGPQRLVGPLRVVPWQDTRQVAATDAQGQKELRQETVSGYLLQAPLSLQVDGRLDPDVRRIGLFDVRVFRWDAQVKAGFAALELPEVEGRRYGQPYLVVGLGDERGLVGSPRLQVDGSDLALRPGTLDLAPRMGGIHAGLEEGRGLHALQLDLRMNLAGTRSLGVAPLADANSIQIQSAWPHPLFSGRFLPDQRQVDGSGFVASWNISSLASSAQSQLQAGQARLIPPPGDAPYHEGGLAELDSVEVALVDPVDVYKQADRASKYGILFVVLTFVVFGLFEVVKQLRIHPLQYLLVGLALAVFFLLLLGLSEHIAFWQAYLVSAAACIGLQFVYLSGVLRSSLRAAGFAALLTALYGALYSLLVSEDNALLMGSILLFGVLAGAMWVTRRIDWYQRAQSLG
jgi:inner membrane protein